MDDIIYDDPVWEYVLVSKIQQYIPVVKKWWDNYTNLVIHGTGVFPVAFEDDTEIPNGLFYRTTSTPVRSPIKNVQAFPFVPTSYLQIANVPGGVCRMIERVCKDSKLKLDGLVIIEKHNLPSTYHKGQFIAFVPEDVMKGTSQLGKYVYLTVAELHAIGCGTLPQSVIAKAYQYVLK